MFVLTDSGQPDLCLFIFYIKDVMSHFIRYISPPFSLSAEHNTQDMYKLTEMICDSIKNLFWSQCTEITVYIFLGELKHDVLT